MKSKVRRFVLSVFAIQLLINVSCTGTESLVKTRSLAQSSTQFSQGVTKDVLVLEGAVVETTPPTWHLVSTHRKSDYSAFYFIDDDVGWACSRDHVFKTIDSGKTWKSTPIDFTGQAEIHSMYFADKRNGWLILREGEGDYSQEHQTRVYKTTDSGKTWKLSHRENAFWLTNVYFSQTDVWMVGARIGDNSRTVPAVIYFSNESSAWMDVSEPLKQLSYDPRYVEGSFPQLGGITTNNSNCVIVVNQSEKIFQSCDNGKNWELIRTIGNTNRPGGIWTKQVEAKDHFTWTLQSVGGIEGVSTLLTVMSTNLDEKTRVMSLPGFFATQGHSISRNEYFVVGKRISFTDDKTPEKGLILHTTDGGETWNKIFKTNNTIKFVQFLPPNPTYIWVLFENGTLDCLAPLDQNL